MVGTKVIRRLAAILAADMVGYSRLMEADEAGTIARQRTYREELIDPKIAEHNGRVVKTTGDGLLAEFASVVDAVQCAVEVQQAIAEREAGESIDRRIRYRVGVNLGDIVVDGDDMFGDGVNVAARLESLAKPGEVLISGTAFDHLKAKLEYGYRFQGERKVKNIAAPVRIYSVLPDAPVGSVVGVRRVRAKAWRSVAAATVAMLALAAAGIVWWRPWTAPGSTQQAGTTTVPATKPSIAVLPFTNLSGDKSQEYFSDGLAADLTTDLGRISGLAVIAKTSSQAYKGRVFDYRKIGAELGVRYVVTGSVRRQGDQIRINARLLEVETGNQLWAERFDRKTVKIFELQDEIRSRIFRALKIRLSAREKKWLRRRPTSSVEAYDLYLKALQKINNFSRDENQEARRLLHRAIELDPKYAAAYALLAQAYSFAQEFSWTNQKSVFAQIALKLSKKAVDLDDELPQAHFTLGRVYSRAPLRNHDRAIVEFQRAISLNPNYADGFAFLAIVLTETGRSEKALGYIEKAMRINPHFPFWYLLALGEAQFFLTRYKSAAESFKKAIKRNPNVPWMRQFLIATYGHLGRMDDAKWEMEELRALGQPVSIRHFVEVTAGTDKAYLRTYVEGLRKAGVPE